METSDIRWHQRFSNYQKAFEKLSEMVAKIRADYKEVEGHLSTDPFLDGVIKEALIQRFEYTYELAWKVMKDFLEDAGQNDINGPKDASRAAFAANIIADGEVWMHMLASRNLTSHTYNQETADFIYSNIIQIYFPAFEQFHQEMHSRLIAQKKQ